MLFLMPLSLWASTPASNVDTITVDSKMGRPIRNIVVRPDRYKGTHDNHAYTVVYLLHGMYGDFTDWSTHMDLTPLANLYNVLIVCPDGQDSFYIDSPLMPDMQFETYIIDELIPAVDSKYNTVNAREGRVITGLSMGGHGALWLAFRHRDLFRACGSMSGAVDLAGERDNDTMHNLLGDRKNWANFSVLGLVPTLKNKELDIYIDEGISDFLYDQNMDLHKALREADIEHEFHLRPGTHSWDFWVESLPMHLAFFFKAGK